ncbi:MAG: TIGR00303 family protein [Planktothrix agardhii KL2]|uniref:nicotinate mononucleotide-dependent phosphoribosyltransferase CobT n=1 Tax=Planktothrix agardhii TaxID=1160 RepID=UPI001A247E09|nr:TIGR00303 family protein [Planktothrix agardhii]MBG0747663.1 TIGR00303 family protein [Planktothrix agardhii KL2]MCF3623787.1 TIGR00303 family protein [Planktothrix agardhii 1801]
MAVKVYTQFAEGNRWLHHYQGTKPVFACVLGFTATALIPGISAAGATSDSRQYTAVADAEFLHNGPQPLPQYPLPPLDAGASPVLISRAVVESLKCPLYLFNAGLSVAPSVPTIDLGGGAARCITSGAAMTLGTVKHLFEQGLIWGERMARDAQNSYLILSECVVGGTTTALAVLLGLGISAIDKVNSSHPRCNHGQKLAIATTGLQQAGFWPLSGIGIDPFELVAAVGDPMQIVVAGMTLAASRTVGVLLAGGTQMLAVYGLVEAIVTQYDIPWRTDGVVVGTTRWVAEDTTGDTVGLAEMLGNVPLLATQLNFSTSVYPQLRAYEQGYVKEGVGAGGAAIAADLALGWNNTQLLQAIEAVADRMKSNY